MRGTRPAIAFVVAIVLAVAATARAGPQAPPAQPQPRTQAQSQPESQPQSLPAAQSASPDVIVQAMGVSVSRIRRQLRESPPMIGPSILRLQFHIEVVAKAPPIEVLKGFNINPASAVPYGGMTHSEFLRITAPPWRRW